MTDFINAPVLRLAIGSIEKLGMTPAAKGPRRMIEEDGRVPLLDVGTVAQIRAGRIKVRGNIARLETRTIVFATSAPEPFDAVILATGFRPDLPPAARRQRRLERLRQAARQRAPTAEPGLFFCGAIASPTGQLREIGIEAPHRQRRAGVARRAMMSPAHCGVGLGPNAIGGDSAALTVSDAAHDVVWPWRTGRGRRGRIGSSRRFAPGPARNS